MKIIIKQIKYLIAVFLGFVIFIFFLFFNLFVKIRFGIIYTDRVGHLCHNVDTYLSLKNKKEIGIFGVTKKVANFYIFNNWKKNKGLYFSKLGFYCYFFLREFFPRSKYLIKWHEIYPNYSSLITKKKNFVVKDLNKKKYEILKKLEIKTPYICFHNRDEAYLNHIGNDGNDHKFRNYNFEDYYNSIYFLNSKKISSVRLGRAVNKEVKTKGFEKINFKEFTNKRSDDFKDVFLINNCEFLVSSATGVSNIASILRKKILLVNTIPFWFREMYQYTKGSIFVPKKIYSKKKKRFLKFSEIENLDYDIHEKNFFEKRDLKVINNSKEEISKAVKEMLKVYKNKKIYNSNLHNKFWGSFKDQKAVSIIRNKINLNISDSFLKKNRNLI